MTKDYFAPNDHQRAFTELQAENAQLKRDIQLLRNVQKLRDATIKRLKAERDYWPDDLGWRLRLEIERNY